MSLRQTWHEWLRERVAEFESARACAAFLGVDESKLSRWGRRYFQEPTSTDLERVAERTKTPLPDLLLMVWAARKERELLTLRPTVGERRRANLSLQSGRIRRRGPKLAAWVFAVASASAWGQPLGAGSARPITAVLDAAPIRGILSRSRRAEAA